ncbi:cytochrome o ubiquinol oxidase subunit IV [Pandoraea pulmonicola]|uniref:Cytochrome bo(3) ubiquinol oxidase subunit 4 n=1 Tax=Pandoraea pulmonicola TaxID=93221 RepID=A0AAJ5CZH7_PANPU|nr:cytochrome o ubiquinol oxidase subunit IV [Pandoraea pulmonicola]AJC21618.1 cytochrome o ubiquinol oxidase subunit IV [Pandoraea pulmonicola]SUA89540.1 Cytochrome o ubiquinol oxidase protein CyoD [Pandoraea pulmonicola]
MTSAHVHEHAHASHGTLRDYVIGFFLSLALTFASFGAVMLGRVPKGMGLAAIVVLCVAQLMVQLVYFLHIGAKRGQRQNSAIFLCTAGLIAIIVAGSLWVMHNANTNMMPTHMSIDRAKLRD